jgi:tetratricopeptide (TPR) repeat protein
MKNPKKIYWSMIFFLMVISLLNCASSGSLTNAISLDEAIKQSAENITAEIPAKSRVAIVAFESPNTNFSDYIMEELTGVLVASGIEVADRQNLEFVRNELGFQLSGEVSDDSAKSIGKFLGADIVITGQMTDIGGSYRYGVNAIHVEQAIRTSITRLTVKNDSNLRRMITALSRQSTERSISQYGVSETVVPSTTGTFIDRGILFATRGNFDIAIMDFSEAIKLSPNFSTAYLLRGRALYASVLPVTSIGDNFDEVVIGSYHQSNEPNRVRAFEQAMGDFNKALDLDPNNPAVYIERGHLYSLMFDMIKAIEDYTQAIRLIPNNAKAYWFRGMAYRACVSLSISSPDGTNYLDRAIADFTQVLQLKPEDIGMYSTRASMYLWQKNERLALRDWAEAIQVNPNHVSAYKNRGFFYLMKDDFSRAIADYTQVIRLDKNDGWAYRHRAEMYHKSGDFRRAISDYQTALKLFQADDYGIDNIKYNLDRAMNRQPFRFLPSPYQQYEGDTL